MKRLVGRYSGESIQGLSEKPLLHTSHDLSVQALQKLLQNPIRFVLATDTTLEDESRITPTLSPDNDVPRRVDQDQAENVSQRQHSFAVSLENLTVYETANIDYKDRLLLFKMAEASVQSCSF